MSILVSFDTRPIMIHIFESIEYCLTAETRYNAVKGVQLCFITLVGSCLRRGTGTNNVPNIMKRAIECFLGVVDTDTGDWNFVCILFIKDLNYILYSFQERKQCHAHIEWSGQPCSVETAFGLIGTRYRDQNRASLPSPYFVRTGFMDYGRMIN